MKNISTKLEALMSPISFVVVVTLKVVVIATTCYGTTTSCVRGEVEAIAVACCGITDLLATGVVVGLPLNLKEEMERKGGRGDREGESGGGLGGAATETVEVGRALTCETERAE